MLSSIHLQVFIEPIHGLQECSLARKLVRVDAQISFQGKAMINVAVQIQLVRYLHFFQDVLRFVSLGWRKQRIVF